MRRIAENPRNDDPDVLLGLDAPDDAAVYRIDDEVALVQTVDFFTPIVDDPYAWGAIAASNAFSDIYAMGGEPRLALNLVGWPREGLALELLASVLEGAFAKAKEAGVSIVGGHTVDDPEPKFGMAVTGFVHPDRIVKASSAMPGDALVLTKPLGTGLLATAIKRGEASVDEVEAVTRTMMQLNDAAARAMRAAGAVSATDVTGFGFLGHLIGLCDLSGTGAQVDTASVPVIPGALDHAAAGMVPGGTRRNQDHYSSRVRFAEDVPSPTRTVLFDAQTSGGLLIAIGLERLPLLLASLKDEGAEAAVVGRITDGPIGEVEVS